MRGQETKDSGDGADAAQGAAGAPIGYCFLFVVLLDGFIRMIGSAGFFGVDAASSVSDAQSSQPFANEACQWAGVGVKQRCCADGKWIKPCCRSHGREQGEAIL